MSKLRIFVASPGDVDKERDIVSVVVQELRSCIGNILDIELEVIRWGTHAWPDIGEDAQDVINREIGEYDILVGIMWRRFGTPTEREHLLGQKKNSIGHADITRIINVPR
jgi:hypothetical protein